MTEVLRHPQDAAACGYDYGEVLFDISKPLTAKGLRFDDLKREVRTSQRMKLGVDIVLPWPWERGRVIKSLRKLRPGGEWGSGARTITIVLKCGCLWALDG